MLWISEHHDHAENQRILTPQSLEIYLWFSFLPGHPRKPDKSAARMDCRFRFCERCQQRNPRSSILQNMFAKLRVPSRTAAGAYAFEHGLV